MRAFLMSITLFELAVTTTLFCWVWAVVHDFPTDKLTVIGATVGLGIWSRIKGQAA